MANPRPRKDVWFVSDEHYGHENIIKYCGRPFSSVQEMDTTLIANHNKLVKDEDWVYHLGDFAYTNKREYVSRLRGIHVLIAGNHDHFIKQADKEAFKIIYEAGYMFQDCGIAIWLSHYPHYVWPTVYQVATAHFFGHVHNNLDKSYHPLAINMCVEMWKYTPVHWPRLYNKLMSRFKNYQPAALRLESKW